jgi:Kef-type K+ transport system membrane component KefB
VVVLLAAKLAGEAAERLGQTAVLGELLAGVLLGPSALNPVAVVMLSTFIVPVWLRALCRNERA